MIYVHFAEQITSTAFVTQATSQEEYIFLKQPSLGLRLRSAYQGFALSPVTHLSEGGIQLDCQSKLIQYY